jgi:hypothetical protein
VIFNRDVLAFDITQNGIRGQEAMIY